MNEPQVIADRYPKNKEPQWPNCGQEINKNTTVRCMRSMQEWARKNGLRVK